MNTHFEQWLRFLCAGSANERFLFQYFFEKGIANPSELHRFIVNFKKHLLVCRRQPRRRALAKRYLAVLSPLCERFGFFQEKMQLDDVCFSFSLPIEYAKMEKIFRRYQRRSQKIMRDIQKKIIQLLSNTHHRAETRGRYKSLYSSYRKLWSKRYEHALHLQDIFGFRIILEDESIPECFDVVDLLHDTFTPIPQRFKDYITIPKINGYQSLHTGIRDTLPSLDIPIEVQVRTRAMDDFAECGLAAHWIYTQEKQPRSFTEKRTKVVTHLSNLSNREVPKVYFFSYRGDLLHLPAESTILDFAYALHTDLGHHCLGAVVNGQPQPHGYVIHEGDRVCIRHSRQLQMNDQWLNYVNTDHARRKIRQQIHHYVST